MTSAPRILIAGTHSGAGKTTVSVGLMAALRKRGITVQPFKVGPDYIDPSYHMQATGRPSRNLDTWLLKKEWVEGIFQTAAPHDGLSVIEGVMGLFDGHSVTGEGGSTAETAKLLKTPVILVVDAKGMARSASALVRGYAEFDPDINLAGVIFNHVTEGHYQLLRKAVEQDTRVPVLGYLPHDSRLTVPERHLGLVPAQEAFGELLEHGYLVEVVERSVRIDAVLKIARAAPLLDPAGLPWNGQDRRGQTPFVRIGVARDRAFHFYYEENLDCLKALGADLVTFSPLEDSCLPEDLDALYLGGGFPEMFAGRLEQNESLRHEIKELIAAGIPTYAECGGLMYLVDRMTDAQGKPRAMVGALPGTVRMTNRLQNFGYVELVPKRANILSDTGNAIKGHEFHYSAWDWTVPQEQAAYTVTGRGGKIRSEGMVLPNLLASYIHIHFLTNDRWARGFISSARTWKEEKIKVKRGMK